MRSHKTDDIASGSATRVLPHGNSNLHLPSVSTRGGSGTSAADAIIVDSDEETTRVSSLSRTDVPRILPIGTLNKDIINYSDSDIELLSSRNKVEDDPEHSYYSPVPLPANVSNQMPSDSSSSRILAREEDAVASSGFRSDDTDGTTSDSEADGATEEVYGADGIDANRISAPHAKSPSLSTLQPIRELLAKRKRRGGPERDVPPGGIIVAPGASKKQGKKEFHEEAPAITNYESEDELDHLASDPQLKRVALPKTDHGRARRLLMPESVDLPLVAITMRGDCHFIERKKK